MSEYQYYEFQAIDRRLTREEMAELRTYSSRARISSTRFTNVYHFGNFKGNRLEWMKRYFDAHLYDSNFGSRVFCLRFPIGWIEPEKIIPYQVDGALEVSQTQTHIILSFLLDTEPGEYHGDEASDEMLTSLLPIRDALAAGDLRALYIAWLSAAQCELVDADAVEPPVPPGLNKTDVALEALTEFLNLREVLVRVAAKHSPELSPAPKDLEISDWLRGIAGEEKDLWLARFLSGDDPGLRREVLAEFYEATGSANSATGGGATVRTVEALFSEADAMESERAEKLREMREKEEHARIKALAGKEAGLWQSVSKLSESSSPLYQESAINTLKDLRVLAAMNDDSAGFEKKLEAFIELRRRKSAFMRRMREAEML